MKKILLITSLFCFSSAALWAQGISGGVRGGLTASKQKLKASGASLTSDSKTNAHFAAYAVLMSSRDFGFQSELIYHTVGSEFEIQSVKVVNRLAYLTVPVMLRWNPVETFNIHAGPHLGFLLAAQQDQGIYGDDTTDDYKSMDVGVGIGIGADSPGGLGLSFRYIFGARNISAQETGEKLLNNTLQLSLCYKLFGE